MIKARHQWWADKIFYLYIRHLLKKHFSAVKLLKEFPDLDPAFPSLLIPNHNTWWDGFFIYFFNKAVCRQRTYLMMLDDQLNNYPFFSRVGAYGIDPHNPKATLRSLKYSVEILEQRSLPHTMVCLFPQGELQPWNPENLKFKAGLDWIIKQVSTPLNCIPLAMRCEFLEEQRPELFFLAENNYIVDKINFKGMDWLQERCQKQMFNIVQSIQDKQQGRILLKGKTSVSKKFDTFRHKRWQ